MGETVYHDPIVSTAMWELPRGNNHLKGGFDKPFLEVSVSQYQFLRRFYRHGRSTFRNCMSNSGKIISVETRRLFQYLI